MSTFFNPVRSPTLNLTYCQKMESFSSHKKSNKLFVIIIIKTVSLISAPLLSIIIIAMKRQKSCQEKNV
ncbi:unnamed protein product [Tenebrio molitor]|nr:unnamed protein product [Tenebrio molitor]